MFTQFWDMNSGGGTKEDFKFCYIEAPQEQARVIFYNRFGHNPDRITCTCCGPDYSMDEHSSLEQLTGYHRNCKNVKVTNGKWTYLEELAPEKSSYRQYISLDEYLKQPDVMIIRADEIKPGDSDGHVPEQGYVWQDQA